MQTGGRGLLSQKQTAVDKGRDGGLKTGKNERTSLTYDPLLVKQSLDTIHISLVE